MTLERAIAVALYTSRPFAASIATLQVAAGRAGEARAELSPTAALNGQLPYYDAPTAINFGGQNIVANPQFDPVYTAAISLPLDIFGSLQAVRSQAQFNELAARIDVNRVRNQVVYDVKNAFFDVLRGQARLAVATDNVNNTLLRLNLANKNYAAGTTSRFDVLTAQRDVANAQQALVTARTGVTISLASLKNVIGIDPTTRVSISSAGAIETPPDVAAAAAIAPPATPSPETPQTAPSVEAQSAAPRDPGGQIVPMTVPSTDLVPDDFDFGPDFPALLVEAMHNRPEVLEADAQVSAAQKGVQYARRSALPSASLSLSYVYMPNVTPFTRMHQEVATLGFSIPIFDGGLARERVREARGQVANAQINRRQAQDQIRLDLQQAYIALVQARQRVAVTNVELAQARESFRISQVRYAAGVSQQVGISPQLELSNAQTSLTQAQTDVINALYDYNAARAQLDRAAGRYAFTGAAPGLPKPPAAKSQGSV